ncbi:MAG: hypothetical protein KJ666_02800 [Bacteroidetes bacterium]|nr:hypothetical protein [Bacteroidota bacterium]MBU2585155.1 hypothetical protein [Bacteroidota bacterium]
MKFTKIFFMLLILAGNSLAQSSGSYGFTDARSLSLANTYTARSLGVDALGINPANLALQDLTSFSLKTVIPLPTIGFNFSAPISMERINYFFGGVDDGSGKKVGRYLTEADKSELGDLLSDGEFITNFAITPLAFTININKNVGAFGFAVTDRLGTNERLSRAFLDLAFSGLTSGNVYSFSDIVVKSAYWRDISLSYARQIFKKDDFFIKELFGGISLKMVQGFYYVGTAKNNSQFQLGDKNKIIGSWDYEVNTAFSPDIGVNYGSDSVSTIEDFSPSLFPTPAGSGFGFDIGFTGKINEQLTVGLALTDIGSITWDKNQATIKGSGNFIFEGYTTKEALDSLEDKFKKITNDLSSSFSTSLPTALRIGVVYQLDQAPFIGSFPGQMAVSFDYNQGFNDEIGNTKTPRFSLGIDWNPGNWIPFVRTGLSFGGKQGFNWAFGLGFMLGPLDFNFATSNFNSLLGMNSAKHLSFGMDTKWRF